MSSGEDGADLLPQCSPPAGGARSSPWPGPSWLGTRRLLGSLALLVLLLVTLLWSPPAFGAPQSGDGPALFERHCVGCHLNGGNVVRRTRTLRRGALQRNGIEGPEAIARIAAEGVGRMGGYGAVLGEEGAELVGEWVWQQALAGWPRG